MDDEEVSKRRKILEEARELDQESDPDDDEERYVVLEMMD